MHHLLHLGDGVRDPDGESRAPEDRDIRQVVWVMTGNLTLTEGGRRYDLAEGDGLGFGPPADVTFANTTDSPCTYLVALARS